VIILDTNVVSEMIRPSPNMKVLARLEKFNFTDVFTTTITFQELYFGATLIRATERYEPLIQRITDLQTVKFEDRVLSFDAEACQISGQLMAEQKMRGEVIDYSDMQIAAIALCKGFTLATRNTKDFEHTGVKIYNPWEGS
jgi:toxin FitB